MTYQGDTYLIYGRRRGKGKRNKNLEIIKSQLPKHSINLQNISRASDLKSYFSNRVEEVWLEIGFGSGEHLTSVSEAHPKVGFLGIEVYEDGIAKTLKQISKLGISNIKLINEDANNIIFLLPPKSITKIFLLFPDPWPKKRHAKRRFVNTENLNQLARIMHSGGELLFATDHNDYLSWSLEQFMSTTLFKSENLDQNSWKNQPNGWFSTRYEQKAIEAGRSPKYLKFLKNDI